MRKKIQVLAPILVIIRILFSDARARTNSPHPEKWSAYCISWWAAWDPLLEVCTGLAFITELCASFLPVALSDANQLHLQEKTRKKKRRKKSKPELYQDSGYSEQDMHCAVSFNSPVLP
jgi:hypothetical protein